MSGIKVVRFNCCGMDVHKDIIVATVAITNQDTLITEYFQKSFGTLNDDLDELVQWLLSFNCSDVCMESTGKYWIPIWNVLEEHLFHVCLVHPKYTKAIKGKKTDKRDSKWITDLFKCDLVRGSFIPPADIRALREIARYYFKLVNMRSSETNRYQNCLTVSNIGIGSIFSDVNGKSAKKIMSFLLNCEDSSIIEEKDLLSLVHKSCKKKDKILSAVKNSRLQDDQRFKIQHISEHQKELANHIEACTIEMITRASIYFDKFFHITGIPGISVISAILIISEIGVDMSIWESSKQLCSWAGLVPASNESANKKKSTRITKAGQYLKPLLVQCALNAVKDPKGYFGIKYRRIKKRRGHKKAIIAIARMMMTCIFNMILTGESFNPTDYDELMNPKPRTYRTSITTDTAIEFLKNSGMSLEDIQGIWNSEVITPVPSTTS